MTLAQNPFPSPTRVALVLLAACGSLLAQADKDEKERREEPEPVIAEKLDRFEDAARDRKFERDGEAAGLVREIVEEQTKKRLHEKDERDVIRTFSKVFGGRLREPEKSLLYVEVAKAFGKFGVLGAAMAQRVYDDERFDDEEWVELRKKLLESIGETKSEKHAEDLLDEATTAPEDYVKAAAGLALRHYVEASIKTREDIVKRLMRNYAKVESQSRSVEPNDPVATRARQTLRAIQDPWNLTLGEITGESFRTASEWQHWYNKNKNTWARKRAKEQQEGKGKRRVGSPR